MGVDDLKELKRYFDQAMPKAKRYGGVNLSLRLANYKYLTTYMSDVSTINRIKLEEQKKKSMEEWEQMINDEMNHLVANEYKAAQEIPAQLMLTRGENFSVTLYSSMSWRRMKEIADRGFIGNTEPAACGDILSYDHYKDISKFYFENDRSLIIRNSQIIGMTIDEEAMMQNINNFTNKLEEIACKYNLPVYKIDGYFD